MTEVPPAEVDGSNCVIAEYTLDNVIDGVEAIHEIMCDHVWVLLRSISWSLICVLTWMVSWRVHIVCAHGHSQGLGLLCYWSTSRYVMAYVPPKHSLYYYICFRLENRATLSYTRPPLEGPLRPSFWLTGTFTGRVWPVPCFNCVNLFLMSAVGPLLITTLTTCSPLRIIRPRKRFSSETFTCPLVLDLASSWYDFFVTRASSVSARTKFMCLSNANSWPVRERPSRVEIFRRKLRRSDIFVFLVTLTGADMVDKLVMVRNCCLFG